MTHQDEIGGGKLTGQKKDLVSGCHAQTLHLWTLADDSSVCESERETKQWLF